MDGKEALQRLDLPSWPLPTEEEVRRAYKTQAGIVHPDVGGSQEEFALLHRAYQLGLRIVEARLNIAEYGLEVPRCPACEGTGYTLLTHGVSQLKIICAVCGGNGVLSEDSE